MQKVITMRIVFSIILGGFLAVAANAANFTVNSSADDQSDGCGAAVNTCTLREAVSAANALAGTDTVTIETTVTTITLATGQISITGAVTIAPVTTNALVTINGDANGRIFNISADTTLNRLRLTNASFSGDGGAVSNNGAVLTINDSIVSGSTATGNGGGISTTGGTVNVNRSTVGGTGANSNIAANGGGIYNNNGTVNLTNSTLSGNTAGNIGGGYYGFASIGAATLNSTSSTIAFNTATNGGGIAVSSTLGLTSTATINNTIISNNTATTGNDVNGNPLITGLPGTITSGGYNIIRNTTGATIVATTGDQFNVDPFISSLASNGGLTPTHALQISPASPAIDKGNTAQTVDQRGFTRPFDVATITNAGNGTDIGAFEAQLNSTSSEVTIGGRVTTATGKAVFRAVIIITDSSGAQRTTQTNPFGYYRFLNVPSGATYVLNVRSKRYTFNSKIISVTEEATDVNFVANP